MGVISFLWGWPSPVSLQLCPWNKEHPKTRCRVSSDPFTHTLAQQNSMASRTYVQVLARSSLAIVSHPGSTKPHLRFLHTVPKLCSQAQQNGSSGSKMLVHFVNQSGMKSSVFVTEGETLLDVVIKKNLDISGFGACEGTLACSTCHLIFEESVYDKLEPTVDEEIDMLDLAYGLTKTSRLGCQVTVERWMDGMTVHVPQKIKDQREKQEAVSTK